MGRGSLNAFLAEINAWEKHKAIFKGSWAKYTKIYRLVTIIVPKSATTKKLHNKTNTTKEDTHFKGHIYHHFLFFILWSVSNIPHYLFTKNISFPFLVLLAFWGINYYSFYPWSLFQMMLLTTKLTHNLRKGKKITVLLQSCLTTGVSTILAEGEF